MKKKYLAYGLCVAMAVSSVSGCGSKKNENTTADVTEAVTEEPTAEPTEEATPEPTEEATPEPTQEAASGLAEAEELPEALYHYTFDGGDEGYTTVARTDDVGANSGATYGIVESSTYVDSDGNEQAINMQYATGPVGNCLYLDGNYGIKFNMEGFDTDDTYTLSFWMNADRLSTYGPTLQLGHNIGYSDAGEDSVAWINFTQTEWGTSSAKIFPVVWNRNSTYNAWPWFYGNDDSIHGKKEWVHVTLVAKGEKYTYTDGFDEVTCDYYLNGQLVYEGINGNYGGMAPEILAADDNFEAYFGINYWDTIYKGYVDDFYVFDSALTAGQVASLYLAGDATVESVAADVTVEEEAAEPEARTVVSTTDASTVIGTLGATTCDNAFWTSFSDGYELADGKTVTLKFKNYGSGINNWENYLLAFANVKTTADVAPSADNYDGYAEYGVLRSDAFAWGFAADPTYEFSWDWDSFLNIMYDATVTLNVTRNAEAITVDGTVVSADGTEYTYKVNATTTAAATDPMYVFMTCEKCYIELLSVE